MYVILKTGTGAGQIRKISDYVGSTKVATVSVVWGTNPDATSTFEVIAGTDVLAGSTVAFNSSLTQTAVDVVTTIGNVVTYPDFTAESSSAELFVVAPKATGSAINGLRLFGVGVGGLTVTIENGGRPTTAGVDAIGGITWQGIPADGAIAKENTAAQGTIASTGTANWIRFCFDPADDGLSASTTYKRLDVSYGVSGADINGSTTSLVAGAPFILGTFPLSVLKTTA
jgi:hypothetical protein